MGKKMLNMLKAVLVSYIVTGLLLLLITFLVYRFEIEEQLVNIGIMATYLLSTFMGGFCVGKLVKRRRFMWGTLVGILYIGLLYGISFAVYGRTGVEEIYELFPIVLCIGGGMFGGMMS